MISNSGVSSILKSSIHGTESTVSGWPSVISNINDKKKTQNPSIKGSFESITSADIGLITSNKCYVCGKGFVLKKKHFCKFCQNAVCSDHSLKTRQKPGENEWLRICDLCEQEEAKRDIKDEINIEVSKLNEELYSAKETNERLNREYFEKTSILNEVEKKIANSEDLHNKRIEQMKEEFNAQSLQAEKTKVLLENLKKTLENTKYSEQDMLEKYSKSEQEIAILQERSALLKNQKDYMSTEIDQISAKLKYTINITNISKSLCQRCSSRLSEAFNKIKNTPYWMNETIEEEEKTLKED